MRVLTILASSYTRAFATMGIVAGIAIILSSWLVGIALPSAAAFYFVVWWLCVFVTLPLGIKSQSDLDEVTPGTDPGAPVNPKILERAILTTIIADIVFIAALLLRPIAGL